MTVLYYVKTYVTKERCDYYDRKFIEENKSFFKYDIKILEYK